jgi:hypothetical protein
MYVLRMRTQFEGPNEASPGGCLAGFPKERRLKRRWRWSGSIVTEKIEATSDENRAAVFLVSNT